LANELASEEALAEFTRRLGVAPSPKLIGDALKKQPQFFDPVTGKFDEQAYERVLTENKLTADEFEGSLTDQIAEEQLSTALAGGLRQPLAYGALLASYQLETRTVSYFLVQPGPVPLPTAPSDQQLQAYMDQKQIRRPEMRVISIVRFNAKALAPTLTPDPADVRKLYDFRKDALSTPEKRSLVEIPAKDAATAQQIIAKLRAGTPPDAVAKAFAVAPIVYADAIKSAVADPKIADAAFQLGAGEVSGPIQTGLAGLAVIEITAATPAKTPTFDEARASLEQQVKADMAGRQIDDEVQKYDDAHAGGSSLTEAARAAGVMTTELGPVSAQGLDIHAQPVQGLTPELLKAAFGLAQGADSELLDDGAGGYFAVRAEKVIPSGPWAIADIRAPLVQQWMSDKMVEALNAKATALAAKIRKGESLEAAAAEVNAQVGHIVDVTRRAAVQSTDQIGQELASKWFAAKAGDIITGQTARIPVMVARIDAVGAADPKAGAQMALGQRSRASLQTLNAMVDMTMAAAKAQIKPTYDLDRVRSALGVSPDEAPKPGSSAPAKAS
jgi:peptidyl-prolyl cis-trans isomerase D